MAVTPAGVVLTGSDDKTVKVWRGDQVRTIKAHEGPVRALAVLPNGARFISGATYRINGRGEAVSSTETLKLWKIDGAGKSTLERTIKMGTEVQVLSIAALSDERFVVGLDNHEIRLYNVNGTHVDSFRGHDDEVNALAVTRDDQGAQCIVSGSQDTHVKVWNVPSRNVVITNTEHTGAVYAVAVTPDGRRILSGGADKTVGMWCWRLSGNASNFAGLHTDWVEALVALPDNQHALSASKDTTVKLFKIDDGTALKTFTHHSGLPGRRGKSVVCLALLPGLRFVSGAYDKTARIVEIGSIEVALRKAAARSVLDAAQTEIDLRVELALAKDAAVLDENELKPYREGLIKMWIKKLDGAMVAAELKAAIDLAESIYGAEMTRAASTAADGGNDDDDDDSGGGGGGSGGGLDGFIVSDDDEESDDDDDDDDDDDGDDDEEIDLSEALRKACEKAKSRLVKIKEIEALTLERREMSKELKKKRDAAGVDKFMPERPEHHFCPLTLKVMVYPVIDALGNTYERAAIEKWLFVATEDAPRGHDTTPLFGCGKEAKLPNKKLTPNHLVSSMINDWEEKEHAKCMARRLPGPGRIPEPGRTVSAPAKVDPWVPPPVLQLDQATCAKQSELLKAAHDASDVRVMLRIIGRLRNASTIEGWIKAVHAAELGLRVKMVAKTAAHQMEVVKNAKTWPGVKTAAEGLVAHWKSLPPSASSSAAAASSSAAAVAPTGEEGAASSGKRKAEDEGGEGKAARQA